MTQGGKGRTTSNLLSAQDWRTPFFENHNAVVEVN